MVRAFVRLLVSTPPAEVLKSTELARATGDPEVVELEMAEAMKRAGINPAIIHAFEKTGLLVTELMGQGVNAVTGDYSRGAAGFWVENGEIQYPVEEITVAGNLRDMYRELVAVGNDDDIPSSIKTGSWLFENMTVGGD